MAPINRKIASSLVALPLLLAAAGVSANSEPYFIPLTESAPVVAPGDVAELSAPWVAPMGIVSENLTSLSEAEGDPMQSVVRVPGLQSNASMFDMSAFDEKGRYIFVPHETQYGAGVSRYDTRTDEMVTLFKGDLGGASGDWSSDYGAFDPATYTPNGTLFLAEEWSGEGRVIEVLNPKVKDVSKIKIRELNNIPNVAHEGLRFSKDGQTLYFIDEYNSGSIYKLVLGKKNDYTTGQVFVLKVDAYTGDAAADYNKGGNETSVRVGEATWVPMTDKKGQALTSVDPFRNGASVAPTDPTVRGGRPAADELGATPYGRPEDIEIANLANGHEVLYFTATSEQAIYSIEMLSKDKAIVRLAAQEGLTPKNVGFAPTTGKLNSPDNLAQDALGNIYVVEDAPNGSSEGGDVWFLRDTDNDGVAESLDHFLSIRVNGSESTGMIFHPKKNSQFVISVQHPATTDMEGGFGDALWSFDVRGAIAPCQADATCKKNEIVKALRKADSEDESDDCEGDDD